MRSILIAVTFGVTITFTQITSVKPIFLGSMGTSPNVPVTPPAKLEPASTHFGMPSTGILRKVQPATIQRYTCNEAMPEASGCQLYVQQGDKADDDITLSNPTTSLRKLIRNVSRWHVVPTAMFPLSRNVRLGDVKVVDLLLNSVSSQKISKFIDSALFVDQLAQFREGRGEDQTVLTTFGQGTTTAQRNAAFARAAQETGVKVLTGDFNGDGKTDLVLVGGEGWLSLPALLSTGEGQFTAAQIGNAAFARAAQETGVKVLTGDFNGDGKTDLVLVGGEGWLSLPALLSTGEGQFTAAQRNAAFARAAQETGVKVLTGDFNGDGKTDLVLVGGEGWLSLPALLSTGEGQFTAAQIGNAAFARAAQETGVKVLTGDFNGDGKTDLVLVGGEGWLSLPALLSTGEGQFTAAQLGNAAFARAAQETGIKVLTGDFNGDGKTDLVLVGGEGWLSLPALLSTGEGQFTAAQIGNAAFARAAQETGIKVLTGDFNGDGKTDLVLVGGEGWLSLPALLSTGEGQFKTIYPSYAFVGSLNSSTTLHFRLQTIRGYVQLPATVATATFDTWGCRRYIIRS